MSRHEMAYQRFRRKLVVGYVALWALLTALLCWKIASDYHSSQEAAAMVARNSARFMAAHNHELVDSID